MTEQLSPAPPAAAAPAQTVPLRERIAWGCGGVPGNLMVNVPVTLGMLIYVAYFKMDPKLAGVALFLPRLAGALADPLVGHLSDNTRSRWGRRRPYLFVSALLGAVLLPLLWTPPLLSTIGAPWHHNGPFLYFSAVGVLQALAASLFTVPHTALGFELTSDYDERTRTLAWCMYIGLVASIAIPSLYWWCLRPVFGNEAHGAFWVSAVLGVVTLLAGLAPALFCRERAAAQQQEAIAIVPAVRQTLTNRPFLILSAAFIVIITGLFSAGALANFINIYYVCGGSKDFGSRVTLVCGVVSALTSYGSMALIGAISRRFSKRLAMNVGLALTIVGALLSWWVLDPRWPWMQLVTAVVGFLGLQGCWLMVSSMIADICDEDELAGGARREGMFSAVNLLTMKLSIALSSLIGGWLLAWTGFDAETVAQTGLSDITAWRMKALFVGIQVAILAVAMLILGLYPISRERAAATRRRLDQRQAARAAREKEGKVSAGI